MSHSFNSPRLRRVSATVALAAGLVAGGVSVASASTTTHASATTHVSQKHGAGPTQGGPGGPGDHGGPGGAGGTVSAVSSSSISVTTLDGKTLTFAITSTTTVDKGHAAASLSDVVVGERVMIRPAAPGSATAAEIDIAVPHLGGQVVSVSGDVITVSDQDGFYRTIDVSSATTYTKSGATASLSDITVGTFVMAEGSVDANHTTLDATSVNVGLPTPPSNGGAGAPPAM